ncbi:MAG: class I SAM-dependent methyltransferase [Saprospiraceae bacterium]|nr:class I SAM-dependent methyltransferase [Saprospiraceae bacterium]
MLDRLKIAARFLKFYWRAKTKYRVHSPFVFQFVEAVLEDDRTFYVFREAEILRGELLNSNDSIEVEDFGAGSHVSGLKKVRKVREIAASALSPAFQCAWLFRLVQFSKPLSIIELGTSLGVSTLYLTEGSPRQAQVLTLEGSKTIADLARRNFDWYYDTFLKIGLKRNNPDILDFSSYEKNIKTDFEKNKIQILVGTFDQTLQKALNQVKKLDFAFIDGNHRREPTLAYFNQCLAYAHEGTVLVFDDIHWSEDMESAWATIQSHPSVRLTIDLFWCGIVFFRHENKEKEHFSLIKAEWKPFSWGFWA